MTRRVRFGSFVVVGLLVAASLALVSPAASDEPDGLERVAVDHGFAEREQTHDMGDLPTSGYLLPGVGDERLSGALAGLVGVAATFALAAGLLAVLRRGRRHPG